MHDPSSVHFVDGRFYVYHTGNRVGSKSSTDRIEWTNGPQVFGVGQLPTWHQQLVPANNGNLWAPDVAFFNNLYHLYYSVSSFGSQDSAIGLVTNPTLNPADPNFAWTDRGPVIESNPGLNAYNAIDPSILQTSTGDVYMAFGSFWNGIYQVKLDPTTGHIIPGRDGSPRQLARRGANDGSAIEAPYVYEREGFFYLFVNWDTCCQGLNSTYNIRVGRGTNPNGPFLDRNGISMQNGGGTLFLATEDHYIGPGHASIFTHNDVDLFGFHYYDGTTQNGTSRYNIRPIYWDADGWPVFVAPVPEPGTLSLAAVFLAAIMTRPARQRTTGRSAAFAHP